MSESVWSKLKRSSGVKASIAFFIANVITKGIAYITTPVYTRLLTSEEYGLTSIFLTWTSVFGIIAMFNLQAGVFNNGMIDYPDRRDDYSFSMLILSNVITIAFSVVLLLAYPMVKTILQIDLKYILLMLCLFLVQPAYNFWVSRQRYEYKYKTTVAWTITTALVSPICAIIFILSSVNNRLFARIYGAEIPLILIYIGFYIYLGFRNNWSINTNYWKKSFLFNLPLLPHYLSMYLLGSSDKIMISHIVGNSATAYYSVAYSVASVATIIWSAANSSLIPFTYQKCKEKNYKAISAVTLPLLTFFASACVFVIMLAPEVVKVMATEEYFEAVYAIPPVVGGVFFQVQYFIYSNIVYYYKKPRYVMYASVTSMITNIILNYIFIRLFGYIAAGYTTLFCYLLQAFIDYFAMRKIVKTEIYNMKYISALSVSVIIIGIFSNLLYDYAFVRYGIVVSMILIAAVKRKRILEILSFKQ